MPVHFEIRGGIPAWLFGTNHAVVRCETCGKSEVDSYDGFTKQLAIRSANDHLKAKPENKDHEVLAFLERVNIKQ